MRIEGEHVFAASPNIVWPLVQDPAVLARSLPGCNEMQRVGSHEYEGAIRFSTGPMRGEFHGRIHLTDIEPPHRFCLHVDGRGPNGYLRGAGEIALHGNDKTTTMTYAGDVEVGGRLANASPRLQATSARAVVRQCLEGLDTHLDARTSVHTTTLDDDPAPDETDAADPHFDLAQHGDILPKIGALFGGLLLLQLLGTWWTNRLARRVARILRAELDL